MKHKTILSWIPALSYMAMLFYLSNLPGDEVNLPAFPWSDKVVHFCAYALLGWLISFRYGLAAKMKKENHQQTQLGIDFQGQATGMIYGFSDEIHQLFVPMRDCSFWDWTADAFGIMAGSWIARKMVKKIWSL